MFWRFGGYGNLSTLGAILDKPDVTTEELLDESDLIQELKQQNGKLIEFLREESVLKKLLKYVISDEPPESPTPKDKPDSPKPEEKETYSFFGKGKGRSRDSKSINKKDDEGETEQEAQEAKRKKYAYVSCEVLSSEVWSIAEAILDQPDSLREFWQYMHRPAPLDPLQAGYFTKVNEALLDKKTAEMLTFFKSLDGILPAMLQHVDCPMVMDLLLKVISLEKHEGGAGIVDWLQQQDLIPLLLGYLSPEHTSATQTSAGDFLKAIITISANATTQDQSVIGPNELTRQLVSEECVTRLIENMLRGGNPLTVGVGIIIEVIRKNNSDYDLDGQIGPEPKTSDPIYLGTLLRQFASHVPDFTKLIRSPSAKRPDLKVAFNGRIEPLGFDRFKTCELMAELLHCSNMGLLNERGAEEEVRKRDAERHRLKAEGKLGTPKASASPSLENSHDGFSSSVDSHGFHHAERPTDDEMDEKASGAKTLDGQNTTDEDGFEKVNAPSTDELPDEVNFSDIEEKAEPPKSPTSPKRATPPPTSPKSEASKPAPLSPRKQNPLHFDPPPTHAIDSPTTAGVTDEINKLGVDEDTVMTEYGEDPIDNDDDGPSELERELAKHSADTPAPLFAPRQSSLGAPPTANEESDDIDQSIATIQGEQPNAPNGERAPYETEADGSPVVGDLLKIQFVEHQVVPTILDFFFRFPWNNFLHNVVYDVVQQVFNGTLDRGYNQTVAFDLFSPVEAKDGETLQDIGLHSTKDITDRILDGQQASDVSQTEKGMRLGYMGHLTLIAEEVCKFGNRQPPECLDQAVFDRVNRDEWIQYVEGPLADTRDKDNAVLGGVRPQDSMGGRSIGLGGGPGFTANTASTLANAGIGSGLASQEGGQSFEITGGTMLSGFGDEEDDDDDMAEEGLVREESRLHGISDDEQDFAEGTSTEIPSIPPPLNVAPSRARQQLAKRLAAKKAEADENLDPDAADSAAVEAASHLPEDPPEPVLDLDMASPDDERAGLHIAGMRTMASGSASRFSGLFAGSDDSSSSDEERTSDEDGAGRDETIGRPEGEYEVADEASSASRSSQRPGWGKHRRPSTTEAKERTPLDVEEDEEEFESELAGGSEGPFADPVDVEDSSSEEDELVEIRPRRTS